MGQGRKCDLKMFIKLLEWLGVSVLIYPIGLISVYFENGGHVSDWFWLEMLILSIAVGVFCFLFTDFELAKKIKSKWHKRKNKNK